MLTLTEIVFRKRMFYLIWRILTENETFANILFVSIYIVGVFFVSTNAFMKELMGMKNIFSFFDCNIVEIWNKTTETRKEIAIQEPYLLCLRDIYKHTTTAWAVNIFTFHLLYLFQIFLLVSRLKHQHWLRKILFSTKSSPTKQK